MWLSTQTPKLSFLVLHHSCVYVYHLLFLFYILMASVWNMITLEGSFSCRSCPGLVRCPDYQPPRPFWLAELNPLQSHFNRRSTVIGTWQWKFLAGDLYVCLTDSSSVLHLCGWEWPCGSMRCFFFFFFLTSFVSFNHLTVGLFSTHASEIPRNTWKHELLPLRQTRHQIDIFYYTHFTGSFLLCSILLNT